MKSLLPLGLLLNLAFLGTGCCHNPCGYRCGRPVFPPRCAPCGGVVSCRGISTGCDSCGSPGSVYGSLGSDQVFDPMATQASSEGSPLNGPQGPMIGGTPAGSYNPSSYIGSDQIFTQPLPPPLPDHGSHSRTIPVSSGTLAPMHYETFSQSPSASNSNGFCPSCNH